MIKKAERVLGKKTKKSIPRGIIHIKTTFNNTIINITDYRGNTLFWASAGGSGFKGSKKRTPFAAQTAAEKVTTIACEYGMRQAVVIVSGPGGGREAAIRALQGCGLQVSLIKDNSSVPHNGCRAPKKRRI
jgi:small subunit ribosomal protein S11